MVTTLSQSRLDNLNCVLGLDCSKYQKDITWSIAKSAGIQFAFIKITEGTTGHEDNLYNLKARVLDAQKNGVKVGYYHFARPGNVNVPEDDANEEVGNVLSHIGFLPKVTLPFVLDIESYSETNIWDDKINHMNRFIKTFIQKLNEQNVRVILYSYKSFIDTNTTPIFGLQPLWIAAYLNNPEVSLPAIPNGWSEWKIWQFTEKGQINGYTGDIDLNIMKKNYFNLF
jgi:GH25 family lysozyme M1 (1,4-beta-N-acetylmuramidase)